MNKENQEGESALTCFGGEFNPAEITTDLLVIASAELNEEIQKELNGVKSTDGDEEKTS